MAKAFCSRAIHDERDYAAGHPDRAPRLDRETWDGMVANVHAIAQLAAERYGVRAVIHPHAGGYIEFDDELDRVAEDVPGEVVGLCLDTGHLDYSGMDPVEGHCHAATDLRSFWRPGSQRDGEDQLRWIPVPAGDH